MWDGPEWYEDEAAIRAYCLSTGIRPNRVKKIIDDQLEHPLYTSNCALCGCTMWSFQAGALWRGHYDDPVACSYCAERRKEEGARANATHLYNKNIAGMPIIVYESEPSQGKFGPTLLCETDLGRAIISGYYVIEALKRAPEPPYEVTISRPADGAPWRVIDGPRKVAGGPPA